MSREPVTVTLPLSEDASRRPAQALAAGQHDVVIEGERHRLLAIRKRGRHYTLDLLPLHPEEDRP